MLLSAVDNVVVDSFDLAQNVRVLRVWNASRLENTRHIPLNEQHSSIQLAPLHHSSLKEWQNCSGILLHGRSRRVADYSISQRNGQVLANHDDGMA